MITGVVTDFNEARGDGWLTADDGTSFYFHCVVIADGTRTIAVGATAVARRAVGHLGRDEAADVRIAA